MIRRYYDDKYHFKVAFDDENGTYYRSNIIENSIDTDKEPFMASFPHLLDIGIMGHCEHGLSGLCQSSGTQCYQSGGLINEANMSFNDYKMIIDQCIGKVFQVALGGRGDPDCHEEFERILKYTRECGIVPNMTTSGYLFNKKKAQICKKYCGAVAVSYYGNKYTDRAINLLINEGVTTNIHFVLGMNTIDKAINMLENNLLPKGISRIIFLLHKPTGMGRQDNVLKNDDKRLARFFKAFKSPKNINRVGYDSCMVPGVINYAPEIPVQSFDSCEGARFTGYIDNNLQFSPCSFDRRMKWVVDLKKHSIEEAWNSFIFEDFRNVTKSSCLKCGKRINCLGGCPIFKEINLCKSKVVI